MNIVNPIGKASAEYITKITALTKSIWTKYIEPDWPAVVHFFLTSLEVGARELDKSGLLNADKKATLLASASTLYDTTVAGLLPVYIRPFNGYIKQFLVSVVLNVLVDYVVDKIHTIESLQKTNKV